MSKTLCLLIHCNLLSQSSIFKLSFINKELHAAYQRYLDRIPKLEILRSEIRDIFKEKKILTFYKYSTVLERYAETDLAAFVFSVNICKNRFLLLKFVELYIKNYKRIDSIYEADEPFQKMLECENALGYQRLCCIFLEKYPEIFENTESESATIKYFQRVFFNNISFFAPFRPEFWPKSNHILYYLYNDEYGICDEILHNFLKYNFLNAENKISVFKAALRCDNMEILEKVTDARGFVILEKDYKRIPEVIRSKFIDDTVFSNIYTFQNKDKIRVTLGYDSFELYEIEKHRDYQSWFTHTNNLDIIKDILTNHPNLVFYSIDIARFEDPSVLYLIQNTQNFDFFSHILKIKADTRSLNLQYLNTWVTIVQNTEGYSHRDYVKCLTKCFYLLLWTKDCLQYKPILDRLIELGVSLNPLCFKQEKIRHLYTVYHLDSLNYLLDNGVELDHKIADLLYESLRESCMDIPRGFEKVIGRINRSL